MIRRLEKPYLGNCGYCARETILRYKVKLKILELDICTMCFEEQEEWNKCH